jgi:hypothetical protein
MSDSAPGALKNRGDEISWCWARKVRKPRRETGHAAVQGHISSIKLHSFKCLSHPNLIGPMPR